MSAVIPPASADVLTVARLLAFEDAHRGHTGAKEVAIRDELGVTPARYYQLLTHAIDSHDAARLYPMLTRVLLRERDEAHARRGWGL